MIYFTKRSADFRIENVFMTEKSAENHHFELIFFGFTFCRTKKTGKKA